MVGKEVRGKIPKIYGGGGGVSTLVEEDNTKAPKSALLGGGGGWRSKVKGFGICWEKRWKRLPGAVVTEACAS